MCIGVSYSAVTNSEYSLRKKLLFIYIFILFHTFSTRFRSGMIMSAWLYFQLNFVCVDWEICFAYLCPWKIYLNSVRTSDQSHEVTHSENFLWAFGRRKKSHTSEIFHYTLCQKSSIFKCCQIHSPLFCYIRPQKYRILFPGIATPECYHLLQITCVGPWNFFCLSLSIVYMGLNRNPGNFIPAQVDICIVIISHCMHAFTYFFIVIEWLRKFALSEPEGKDFFMGEKDPRCGND